MSRRTAVGLCIVFLGLLIALFHWCANVYYLYWEWWWADIVMHFLGGLFIGLSALWWIRFEVPLGLRPRVPVFLTAFSVVLLVGIAWEIFEYVFDAYGSLHYVADTTLDLVMDMVGMCTAYVIFLKYGE